MNRVTMTPAAPSERDIAVTVTLPFRESQLRKWEEECSLARRLGEAFNQELADGDTGDNLYDLLNALS